MGQQGMTNAGFAEMTADVVALVKKQREERAPRFQSLGQSVMYHILHDPRCVDKRERGSVWKIRR